MRKAIFIKFIKVLLAALLLNSFIFYLVTGTVLLNNVKGDMLYTLEVIDTTLDYSSELSFEVAQLDAVLKKNSSRLSLIDQNGTVVVDSGVPDPTALDNHLQREEVMDAILLGHGDSRRYSGTLSQPMLYVALRSEYSPYILRLAMPYHGMQEYLLMLFPAIWLSLAVALLVSAEVAQRFSASVTKPLHEISMEMKKIKNDARDFSFEPCQYPEINIIAETTTKMSKDMGEYLDQIELEKQIRQEFFSNASHELKTPITSVQGYAELLESGMIDDENVKLDFIKRIKKEAVNMANLINDILMISKLETREMELVKTDVRISLVLEDVIQSIKPLAVSQQVLIHVDCQPLSFYANTRQIEELCSNLISNAVKYNRPGGQVWVTVKKETDMLLLSVKDNGSGIPKESIPRIFERFYRVDKGRSKKQGGTGLGLSIVKHIVNYYGGSISVDSEPDRGTEFTVRLPVKPPVG